MSRRSVVLDTVPRLGGLYAAALANQTASRVRARLDARPVGALALPDLEYRVGGVRADPVRLLAYQRLMGDTVRDVLPSVLVHGMVFPVAMSVLADRAFPLPLLGMVHLAHEVEHRRAIASDELLDARAWTQNLRPHHAGTQFDVVCEVSAAGALAWRGVSTYLAKGVWDGPRPQRPEREAEAELPLRTAVWRLGSDVGRRYAGVLGDYNPIHLGKLPARALGIKRHIAHGMYLAGRALAATAPHDGGYAWSINFEAPVFLPGTVQFGVEEDDAGSRFVGWHEKTSKRHFSGSVRPVTRGWEAP
jgi:acyl dehydratase